MTTTFKTLTKDPDAVLDYMIDWGQKWLPAGDTITASTFDADSDDITIDSSTHTDTTATVWLSAGVVAGKYQITNHITTSQGRQNDYTFIVQCREL